MFQNWGFLITEIWVLLLLAALLGLLAGRIIWGGRSKQNNYEQVQKELADCKARLNTCQSDLADCKASKSVTKPAPAAAPVVKAKPAAKKQSASTRPEALKAARNGKADDLQQIKGVGAKMEKLCNSLGFYHFDQIANWTKAEVAWVDDNLEGFKGRVTRDNWVAQAKKLAKG